MKINKNSLQARIMNKIGTTNVPANAYLQCFFFDAFLKRLAKSSYKDNFVFKGGYLLSTSLGIDFRSTMDMDFLIRKMSFVEEEIVRIIKEISVIDVDDNVSFEYIASKCIREDDEYGGYNISFLGRLENIKVVVSIDVVAGDPITPAPINYQYKCMFDNSILNIVAYNLPTIVAEKLQTVLFRKTLNSRCKDFYDLYIIHKLKINAIDANDLRKAFFETCNYRKTMFALEEALQTINDIKKDDSMEIKWHIYAKRNSYYVSGIVFEDVIDAMLSFVKIIFAGE